MKLQNLSRTSWPRAASSDVEEEGLPFFLGPQIPEISVPVDPDSVKACLPPDIH